MAVTGNYNFTSSDGTTAQFAVGDMTNVGGNYYQYCKATAAAIAQWAILSGASPAVVAEATTTTATALGTGGGFCAIAPFAVAASEYFWALVGPFYLNSVDGSAFKVLAANVTAGNLLYSTATAGVLDDDSSGSTIPVIGLVLTTTVTTQAATGCTAFKKLGWLK